MRVFILYICVLPLLLGLISPVQAGNPAPLFDKPVKVDDSGRPLVNSWERYEYERKLRLKKKQQGSEDAENKKSGPESEPTPTSTIINRPINPEGSL